MQNKLTFYLDSKDIHLGNLFKENQIENRR